MEIWTYLDYISDFKYFFWIILLCFGHSLGTSSHSIEPRFLHGTTSFTFNVGDTAILTCTVQNLGTKTVTWRKLPYITPITTGEKLFAQDTRFQAVHIPWKDQWNLSIKNVQVHDAGIYECQVGTREKKLRHNVTLSVIDSVSKKNAEIKITGTEFPEKGASIYLLCNAKGRKYPPDKIEWYKNGERLFTDPFEKLYIKEHVAQNAGVLTSSLEIKNAKMEDNGTYICRATSNSEDTMTTSINVNVLSSGSNYAKRGTLNDSTRPESVDSHDAAKFLNSTAGLICSLIFIQLTMRAILLS